ARATLALGAIAAALALIAAGAGLFGGRGDAGWFGGRGGLAFAQPPAEQSFPHARHARLFPTCQGCHAGIERGDTDTYYPTPALCANCHDGVERRAVRWQGPSSAPTNLRFSHPVHIRESGRAGEPVPCMSCHGVDGAGTAWMVVA